MLKQKVNALYKAGKTDEKHLVYVVAMSDDLKRPEVGSVDVTGYTGAVGQSIMIEATEPNCR